jgi:hypothetical protein
MNRHDGLERELIAWFDGVASPSVPDYTNDIVQLTAGRRQRPRWTFPERWLPMNVEALQRVPMNPLPWRTIGLLAVIALLTAALVVTMVGSPPKLPAPFGLAANGLVAYVEPGGIGVSAVDPVTGERTRYLSGAGTVRSPRWSLDGSRIAFLRQVTRPREEVVIVDATAGATRLVISPPLVEVDSDGLEWAPDGRSLLVVHGSGTRRLGLMDTETGTVTDLDIPEYAVLEAFFRPPDGREVVFVSGSESAPRLATVSLPDLVVREVPLDLDGVRELRPMGWTPDGSRIVLHRDSPRDGHPQTYLVDPVTGAMTALDVAYGHVSHDGRWVAGLTVGAEDRTCVVSIDGGPCRIVGDAFTVPFGAHGKALQWSPDDEWLVVRPHDGEATTLVDPHGDAAPRPDHLPSGIESWQRRAP